MTIKITNCTIYYISGRIRNNQNVRIEIRPESLSEFEKNAFLWYYKNNLVRQSDETSFKATNSSKIVVL